MGTKEFRRMIADVNGDHLHDIIGFGDGCIHVLLNKGFKFEDSGYCWEKAPKGQFTFKSGWDPEKHQINIADINGDGLNDIIGFHDKTASLMSLMENLLKGFPL